MVSSLRGHNTILYGNYGKYFYELTLLVEINSIRYQCDIISDAHLSFGITHVKPQLFSASNLVNWK